MNQSLGRVDFSDNRFESQGLDIEIIKEQYNKLLRHSSMQSRVIDGLQKTMQHIIKKVGSLTEVVDRLDGVDVPDDSSSSSIENLPIVKKSENSKSRRSGLKVRF